MAAFAPIPSARETIAMIAMNGFFIKPRMASCNVIGFTVTIFSPTEGVSQSNPLLPNSVRPLCRRRLQPAPTGRRSAVFAAIVPSECCAWARIALQHHTSKVGIAARHGARNPCRGSVSMSIDNDQATPRRRWRQSFLQQAWPTLKATGLFGEYRQWPTTPLRMTSRTPCDSEDALLCLFLSRDRARYQMTEDS